jgi:hypothetical protein
MITKRDLTTAVIAASLTLACVSLADEPVFSDYDPEALTARFRSGTEADFLVDRVLRRE